MKVVLLSLREMLGPALSFSVVETKKNQQNIINGNRISVARELWERGCFRENNSSAIRPRSYIELFSTLESEDLAASVQIGRQYSNSRVIEFLIVESLPTGSVQGSDCFSVIYSNVP